MGEFSARTMFRFGFIDVESFRVVKLGGVRFSYLADNGTRRVGSCHDDAHALHDTPGEAYRAAAKVAERKAEHAEALAARHRAFAAMLHEKAAHADKFNSSGEAK
jgi:hypothetical protein